MFVKITILSELSPLNTQKIECFKVLESGQNCFEFLLYLFFTHFNNVYKILINFNRFWRSPCQKQK